MLDIVIVNVPGTLVRLPFAAPALLKSAIQTAGFTCTTVDLNIKFYHSVPEYNIPELENYFTMGIATAECEKNARKLAQVWADEIIKLNPKHLGISVFTYQNRVATKLLCECIKQNSAISIVLGGQGLTDGGILGSQGFAKELILEGLADYYIKSEGEVALVELIKGNLTYLGINSDTFEQIQQLDNLPIPDYSDYYFEEYDSKTIPITSSRGCVRACSFCDIHDHWKYRYRSGNLVAEEMILLHEKYNINTFAFTDSLVNGNIKEFNQFCDIMAQYNSNNSITWSGQFIIRPEKSLTEEFWIKLAKSGATKLAIGIETGSDAVRNHMNKKFTNVDIDYTMAMLDRYNITCVFLMIIGYPTETAKDFQETLDMFSKYKSLANRIIVDVNLGSTLGILPGTPLYNNATRNNIILDKYENNWISQDNIDLSMRERLRRVKYATEFVRELGYMANDSAMGILDVLERQVPLFETRNMIKQKQELRRMND